MTIKRKLNSFLEEYYLYNAFEAVTEYSRDCYGYTDPFLIDKQTFNSFCPYEDDIKVFELTLPNYYKETFGRLPASDGINYSFINEEGKLDYIQYFEGICTGCHKHKIGFLLHIYSDYEIPTNLGNIVYNNPSDDILINQPVNIYIEKVGEYPKKNVVVDKEVSKVLDRESTNWYYKAQSSLKDNLGIGAFAYFRRIIEKELLGLAEEVSNLKHSKSKEMKDLILEYKNNGKTHLLYENIYDFLPPALKALGDNPFSLLYKQASKGLHELTEKECLEKSEAINYVLTFLIRKLYEEKQSFSETNKYINILRD